MPLAQHSLKRFGEDLGREISGWSEDVERRLMHAEWRGVVRELENTIERAVVMARTDTVEVEDLMLDDSPADRESVSSLRALLDEAAAAHIRTALASTGGRKAEASERLGIDRVTLYRLMRKHGID